jgi:hypothetical protein
MKGRRRPEFERRTSRFVSFPGVRQQRQPCLYAENSMGDAARRPCFFQELVRIRT